MEGNATPLWPQMTAGERAAAYSPSSMVGGNLDPFIQAYKDQSRAAYGAVSGGVHTLAYGAKVSQSIDLALPAQAKDAPLHVFIHGGYWQELSKKESFFPATGSLSHGIGFAALDYTLAPHASMDEIVAEIVAALRHLRDQAARLGIDHTRIVVSGSSAGAHLAAMACLEMEPAEHPAGLILLSGIYDLRPLVDIYVNDALGMDEAAAQRNSPTLRAIADFPPSLIAWAQHDTDEFKRQSRQFAQSLHAATGRVHTLEVAGRTHFDIVHDLTEASSLGRWLLRMTQPKER